MSWHMMLHALANVVGFNSLTGACFVFAWRFAATKQGGWAAYSAATGLAILALGIWPNRSGTFFVPVWVAAALGFGWASAMAARLMTGLAYEQG